MKNFKGGGYYTQSLKIGLAQAKQTASLESNAATIFNFIEKVARQGVQILCFPETQTAGYRVDITPTNSPVEVKKLAQLHHDVARRCGELNMACILGTETPLESDPEHGRPYNSALVIAPTGDILGVHHKTKLTPLDAIAYSPGTGIEVFELFGVTVGIVICYEGFRFARTTRKCVEMGARLVFHPQNNTTRPNNWKVPVHHAMITTRAAENTIWFTSCNICQPEHQNCRSIIVAPDGQIHAQAELKQEQLIIADIDVALATQAMYRFDVEQNTLVDCGQMLFGNSVAPAEFATAKLFA